MLPVIFNTLKYINKNTQVYEKYLSYWIETYLGKGGGGWLLSVTSQL